MLQEGRKQDAEEVVQQLRIKQPTSADVAAAIGDFYLAASNPDAALKEYQRGLNYDPKNSAAAGPHSGTSCLTAARSTKPPR